jgi:hypothetical protein
MSADKREVMFSVILIKKMSYAIQFSTNQLHGLEQKMIEMLVMAICADWSKK